MEIKNIITVSIVASLIFCNIPETLAFKGLGILADKLVVYPLIALLIYNIYINNYKIRREEIIFKYIIIFVFIEGLSLFLGWWNLSNHIDILWLVCKATRNILVEVVCIYLAYLIFKTYKNQKKLLFELIYKGIMLSCVCLMSYSFLEIGYLAGNNEFKKILSDITPYVHTIKRHYSWWPPLLWSGQMRSVFAEPSYFGIYSAFLMPFLWMKVIQYKNIRYVILTLFMTFCLFLTQSRTGFMLHIGQLLLLFLSTVLFLRNKKYLKSTTLVLVCSIIAFAGNGYFINTYMNTNKNIVEINKIEENKSEKNITKCITNVNGYKDSSSIFNKVQISSNDKNIECSSVNETMKSYVDSNMTSLVNPDRRSNRARYSIMEADFSMGVENPLLGVGTGLRNMYIPMYIPQKGVEYSEVRMWLDYSINNGIVKSDFPKAGEYTSRFAENGFIGLFVFLFPSFFLLYKLIKIISSNSSDKKIEYIVFMISLIGIIASGIGDTLNITWCYWFLLGTGYVICYEKERVVSNEET